MSSKEYDAAMTRLLAEYAVWCAANKLERLSVDEMLFAPTFTPEQRRWLNDYLQRLETMEIGENARIQVEGKVPLLVAERNGDRIRVYAPLGRGIDVDDRFDQAFDRADYATEAEWRKAAEQHARAHAVEFINEWY